MSCMPQYSYHKWSQKDGPIALKGVNQHHTVLRQMERSMTLPDIHMASLQTPRKRTPSLRSSFNTRARDGYVYWFQEKVRVSNSSRYGVGTKHTFLGLGFAPRT